jgi:multimeric flavodoxin WrbA
MKILALLGSPRPAGNTRAVLDTILTAAEQAGAQTETVPLSKLDDLTGCMECNACQEHTDEPGCAVKDDMPLVIGKAIRADVIVWATPVFCWSPSWLLKMALDRFYCTFKFTGGDDVRCLLQGRKMAAVITGGGGENDGADSVRETCRRFAQFANCQWIGAFVAGNVETPETIRADADLTERARAFGRQLAS